MYANNFAMFQNLTHYFIYFTQEDTYSCTSHKLASNQKYITGFEAIAHAHTVHHILVYACERPGFAAKQITNCGGRCVGKEKILFAWGLDAPKLKLPTGT